METNKSALPPIPVSFQALISEISRMRPDLANQISGQPSTSVSSGSPSDSALQNRRLAEGISTAAIAMGTMANSPHQARAAAMMASDALRPRPHESLQDSEERLGLVLASSYEKLSRSLAEHPQNLMGRALTREISETLVQSQKSPAARQSVKDEIERIAETERASSSFAPKLLAESLDKASLLGQVRSLGPQAGGDMSPQPLKAPPARQEARRPSLGPNVCQR